jgi:hypothetical protein
MDHGLVAETLGIFHKGQALATMQDHNTIIHHQDIPLHRQRTPMDPLLMRHHLHFLHGLLWRHLLLQTILVHILHRLALLTHLAIVMVMDTKVRIPVLEVGMELHHPHHLILLQMIEREEAIMTHTAAIETSLERQILVVCTTIQEDIKYRLVTMKL